MIRPRVSVIIPVYNTGNYLDEALMSLKKQTLNDIEVIAIDDGSTDNSAEILQEWSSKLDMVILTKKNAGQAAARNDGLDIAAGDYIYFLDSDDWIDPDTLETCVTECDRNNLDFVFFDAVSFTGDGKILESQNKWFDYHRGAQYPHAQPGPVVMNDMLRRKLYRCSVCMSLFRRTFLMKNAIRFKDGIIHEDELFSALAYFNADRVKGLSREFYHRRIHDDSTMTRVFSKKNVDGYLAVAKDVQREGRRPECWTVRKKLVSSYMLSLMHNGGKLDFKTKCRIAFEILFKYPYAFKLKPFTSFLFKKGRLL